MKHKYYIPHRRVQRFAICLLLFVFSSVPAWATVNHFVVTSTADPSLLTFTSGTLRWAVDQANNSPVGDDNYIDFNISGTGPFVINLLDGITITSKVHINGGTQAPHSRDYTREDPLIILDGSLIYTSIFDIINTGSYDASGSDFKVITFRNGTGIAINNIFSLGPIDLNYINIENCLFYTDVNGPTYSVGGMDGIYVTAATNIAIKGCYFGTNHSLDNSFTIDDCIFIEFSGALPTKKLEIGGAGTQANVFYNYYDGIVCTNYASPYMVVPNSPDRVHITQNKFLKVNPAYYFPAAIYLIPYVNNNIQPPVITSVDDIDNTITGTSANLLIELFKSNGPETATEYLGSATADGSGNWVFKSNTKLSKRQAYTATANDVADDGR